MKPRLVLASCAQAAHISELGAQGYDVWAAEVLDPTRVLCVLLGLGVRQRSLATAMRPTDGFSLQANTTQEKKHRV